MTWHEPQKWRSVVACMPVAVLVVAAPARHAVTTTAHERRRHPLATAIARHRTAHGHYPPGQFVTRDVRKGANVGIVALPAVPVAATVSAAIGPPKAS